MLNRFKVSILSFFCLLLATTGCKKGTFDINDPNPNLPSSVSPSLVLSEALAGSAYSLYGNGFPDLINGWMGYWAFSGDYGGYGTTATYNINNGTAGIPQNWDYVYNTVLVNYKLIETESQPDPTQDNYRAIAKIMLAYHFTRLVDLYGNIPYSQALQGVAQTYPVYDDAASVYKAQFEQLDSAIAIINNSDINVEDPGKYDIMFGGDMGLWIKFANTVKLQAALTLSEKDEATGKAAVAGLTEDDFLSIDEDASINPGYSNSSQSQQNPFYGFVGFQTNGSSYGSHDFYRANSFAVNFYKSTGDQWRISQVYDTIANGTVVGRAYGSLVPSEHNSVVSAIGPGVLSATAAAPVIGAYESLFMQAEAEQRGWIAAGSTVEDTYAAAVQESFRIVGDANYEADAADYLENSTSSLAKWSLATDKIRLIVTQEWIALNQLDPLNAYNNYRRLGIPANLPVSIYPGTAATHIPYRFFYPQSEFNANAANVAAQGDVDILSSKIFWMP